MSNLSGRFNIIIVYPQKYEELAFLLQHAISKVDDFDCVAWNIEQFDQNRVTLSGKSNIIFIGDSDENKFSKMIVPTIKKIESMNGSYFGFDGNKAVIFGDGKLSHEIKFDEFIQNVNENIGDGGARIATLIGQKYMPTGTISGVLNSPLGLGGGLVSYFITKSHKSDLRQEQTKRAMYAFITRDLDNFVGYKG